MKLRGVRDAEEVGEKIANTILTLVNDHSRIYTISSLCRFPFYQVDFGWGKPLRVMLRSGNLDANITFLMGTPSADGIEATVQLEEEMAIFQKNKELLAYVEDI